MVKIYSIGDEEPRRGAFLIYSPPKCGKTSFAGTFPHPVFIVPTQERGITSLNRVLDEMRAVNPDARIDYIPVCNMQEMIDACWFVVQNAKQRGWETAVMDPFTIYGRIAQQEMEHDFEGKDRRDLWGRIGNHYINLWNILSQAPVHTVWVLHESAEEHNGIIIQREPALPGRIALQHLLGAVDLILYMQKWDIPYVDEKTKEAKVRTERAVFTKCPAGSAIPYICGGRWEERLPEGCYQPRWEVFAKRLEGVLA